MPTMTAITIVATGHAASATVRGGWHKVVLACLMPLGLAMLPASLLAADIYRALKADGQYYYATQPLDASYELFARGESASTPAPRIPRTQSAASARRAQELKPLIASLAQKHGVDLKLVWAIIQVESRFNPQALSHKGASGLMQLMPATAARYGVRNRFDVAQNLEGGIRYLKDLLARHDGNLTLTLAAYNAGSGAVSRHGQRIPPYRETMLYVPAVLVQMQVED